MIYINVTEDLTTNAKLLTIYKVFVRPHLIYGDVLYDQACNMSFNQKLKSIQYNACWAITGTIQVLSKEKIYQELGLESLQLQRWYRKLGQFYKIYKSRSFQYLFELIPEKNRAYATRNVDNILFLKLDTTFSKALYFQFRSFGT